MELFTDQFLNKRNKKIFCYYWKPAGKPRALLLICHGFTDHTMMYESLAKEMVRRGFFVFANDHAGHGRSEGTRAHMNSIYHLIEDTASHIEKMKAIYPDIPFFIWGHSMGGAMAILTALQKKLRPEGVIAVAPAILPNPETATPFRLTVAKIFARIVPYFPVAFADISLSCQDPEQVKKLNSDPLRHRGYFMAGATVSLLQAGEDILKQKDSFDVPYLLLHGDEDKVCDILGSETFHRFTASKDKTFYVYRGGYHSLFQEPKEISSDVLSRSICWIEERS